MIEICAIFSLALQVYIGYKLTWFIDFYLESEKNNTDYICEMFIVLSKGMFEALEKYDKRWSKHDSEV